MLIDFKINPTEFKEKYQEKKPLVIKKSANPSVVSWNDINDIIARTDADSINFRVSFPHGNVPKEEYIDTYFHVGDVRKKLKKIALYKFLKEGATVVANNIYDEPRFNDYAKDIAQLTGRQTVTSAYIAFGEVDSYRAHWDSRDVFAVQLVGKKRWVIYKPSFDAPLYMHQSKFIEDRYPCPSEPYMDFILEEGDVLYIPRGWWHNVTPLGEPTVHLAIGTFPSFALDYVKWIFRQLPESVHARQAFGDEKDDRATISALSEHISALMNDSASYRNFMEQHLGEQRIETRLNLDLLGDANVKSLETHLKVRLNVLQPDAAEDHFATSTGKIYFRDELRDLKGFLARNPETTIGALLEQFQDRNPREVHDVILSLATRGVIELLR
ncbi:cupin domain-containing protein [Variovorax sp. ZS18.2.2]|uniref:cupin domain-containing protein n=1 Tax=Variovorax sp. ZS18.2.2 TaxID=2971255 RepID=UPI00215163B9|nr:cupin domain-containing protein [Variovorax sp. ZS18.2.2]MCR6476514.1 cupin domain-containing protein [Variovorax sp. ZS18.2.2]